MLANPNHFGISAFNTAEWSPFPKIEDRVTAYQTNHVWLTNVNDKLDELCGLPKGWDGYEALPVSNRIAAFAVSLLEKIGNNLTPNPQMVPGIDGDLQIEWHLEKGDIELHVRSPYDVIAWRSTEEAPDDGEEVKLRTDFTIVSEWLKQVAE